MKHLAFFLIFILLISWLSGCSSADPADLVATTLPVYEFTARLCQGTGLTVTRLITENISCLHDYTLQVQQMLAIESADAIIISGAGLESFLGDVLDGMDNLIDASEGISLMHGAHSHEHGHSHHDSHEEDPHIWLSPNHAKSMSENICCSLSGIYPEYATLFSANLKDLHDDLDALQTYGLESLQDLRCRQLVTFHDGFSYLAESFGLTILESVEEESGSEASSAQLIHLIHLVQEYHLPAIFTETNGAASAADIIAAETHLPVFALDMAMSGNSYFDAMYHNIDTIKEALG